MSSSHVDDGVIDQISSCTSLGNLFQCVVEHSTALSDEHAHLVLSRLKETAARVFADIQSSKPDSFQKVPSALLIEVLRMVDDQQLLRISVVSHRFYRTIQTPRNKCINMTKSFRFSRAREDSQVSWDENGTVSAVLRAGKWAREILPGLHQFVRRFKIQRARIDTSDTVERLLFKALEPFQHVEFDGRHGVAMLKPNTPLDCTSISIHATDMNRLSKRDFPHLLWIDVTISKPTSFFAKYANKIRSVHVECNYHSGRDCGKTIHDVFAFGLRNVQTIQVDDTHVRSLMYQKITNFVMPCNFPPVNTLSMIIDLRYDCIAAMRRLLKETKNVVRNLGVFHLDPDSTDAPLETQLERLVQIVEMCPIVKVVQVWQRSGREVGFDTLLRTSSCGKKLISRNIQWRVKFSRSIFF